MCIKVSDAAYASGVKLTFEPITVFLKQKKASVTLSVVKENCRYKKCANLEHLSKEASSCLVV